MHRPKCYQNLLSKKQKLIFCLEKQNLRFIGALILPSVHTPAGLNRKLSFAALQPQILVQAVPPKPNGSGHAVKRTVGLQKPKFYQTCFPKNDSLIFFWKAQPAFHKSVSPAFHSKSVPMNRDSPLTGFRLQSGLGT